jgi:hypothetical protein
MPGLRSRLKYRMLSWFGIYGVDHVFTDGYGNDSCAHGQYVSV